MALLQGGAFPIVGNKHEAVCYWLEPEGLSVWSFGLKLNTHISRNARTQTKVCIYVGFKCRLLSSTYEAASIKFWVASSSAWATVGPLYTRLCCVRTEWYSCLGPSNVLWHEQDNNWSNNRGRRHPIFHPELAPSTDTTCCQPQT